MKILIRNGNNDKWQLVQSAPYGAESKLQEILAGEPSLISVDEVREGAGSLTAAIREFPLEVGSIDILGFTANGSIAIVECKLANNLEIKRKVIGQVLDYGANVWGMDYETLDDKVRQKSGKNLADLVRESVDDPNWDEEAFRANIVSTLEMGSFILIIVVDEINDELSRIIRFVNDAGQPTFAFAALEMQRYQHGQSEMLVPHVFGTVAKVKQSTRPVNRRKWDEAQFFEELTNLHPDSVVSARKILDWVKKNPHITRIYWGEGGSNGSFVPIIEKDGVKHQLFAVYTYNRLEMYFYWYKDKAPFASTEKRKELLDRLNHIRGINLPEDAIERRPGINLSLFNEQTSMAELLSTFDWIVDEIVHG